MFDRWTITIEQDGTCIAKNSETGEIREVKRDTLESSLRTLGRTFDKDVGR